MTLAVRHERQNTNNFHQSVQSKTLVDHALITVPTHRQLFLRSLKSKW